MFIVQIPLQKVPSHFTGSTKTDSWPPGGRQYSVQGRQIFTGYHEVWICLVNLWGPWVWNQCSNITQQCSCSVSEVEWFRVSRRSCWTVYNTWSGLCQGTVHEMESKNATHAYLRLQTVTDIYLTVKQHMNKIGNFQTKNFLVQIVCSYMVLYNSEYMMPTQPWIK